MHASVAGGCSPPQSKCWWQCLYRSSNHFSSWGIQWSIPILVFFFLCCIYSLLCSWSIHRIAQIYPKLTTIAPLQSIFFYFRPLLGTSCFLEKIINSNFFIAGMAKEAWSRLWYHEYTKEFVIWKRTGIPSRLYFFLAVLQCLGWVETFTPSISI
jgi:hypothetical protein